jgi:hypothetical protein
VGIFPESKTRQKTWKIGKKISVTLRCPTTGKILVVERIVKMRKEIM